MSILEWSVGLANGAPAQVITPISWAISTGALGAFALSRMRKAEL